jgi:transcription elongation factor Elf1
MNSKELERWKKSVILTSSSNHHPLRKVPSRSPKIFNCFCCSKEKSMIVSLWKDYNSRNLKNPIIIWCQNCGIKAPLILKLGQENVDAFCFFQDFYYKKPFVFRRNPCSENIEYQEEFYWRWRKN